VALEAGTHSPWSSRLLKKQGHEVLVADPDALHQKGRPKTDTIDAEQLARWARIDPSVLHPIQHRGDVAQADLTRVPMPRCKQSTRNILQAISPDVQVGYVGVVPWAGNLDTGVDMLNIQHVMKNQHLCRSQLLHSFHAGRS
jgi:hypothetical protein